MLTNRPRFGLWSMILRAPEGEAGGEAGAAESVLFPKEGEAQADPPAGDAQADGVSGDWKEYEPDPAKSDEENAAAKAEHDKTKPAADDKGKDDPADKVPDDGKYTLTMPEGIELDAELADALGPDFKELGLTNRQAQRLADKFIAIQTARATKQGETWAGTVAKWVDDAKADKEIGGAKWDATVSNATRAVKTLGTPELKDYLEATGGGNHPELIRFMAKVGAMIKEDDPANGGAGGAGKPADPAHLLFPNDAPKGS